MFLCVLLWCHTENGGLSCSQLPTLSERKSQTMNALVVTAQQPAFTNMLTTPTEAPLYFLPPTEILFILLASSRSQKTTTTRLRLRQRLRQRAQILQLPRLATRSRRIWLRSRSRLRKILCQILRAPRVLGWRRLKAFQNQRTKVFSCPTLLVLAISSTSALVLSVLYTKPSLSDAKAGVIVEIETLQSTGQG